MELDVGILISIFGVVISVLASWYSSDRWVEKAERKRLHSEKLLEVTLNWLQVWGTIYPIDTIMDNNIGKFIMKDIIGLNGVPLGIYLLNHIITGYEEVNDMRLKYIEYVKEYTSDEINIKNDIIYLLETEFSRINIDVWFPIRGRNKPKEHIRLDYIVDNIINEIYHRSYGWENYYQGKLTTEKVISGNETHWNINWMGYQIMVVYDQNKFEDMKIYIDNIMRADKLIERVNKLYKKRDELIKYGNNINSELTKIMDHIKLGNNIRGHCQACP